MTRRVHTHAVPTMIAAAAIALGAPAASANGGDAGVPFKVATVESYVTALAWDADGKRIAVAEGSGRSAKVFSREGALLWTIKADGVGIMPSIDFVDGGTAVVLQGNGAMHTRTSGEALEVVKMTEENQREIIASTSTHHLMASTWSASSDGHKVAYATADELGHIYVAEMSKNHSWNNTNAIVLRSITAPLVVLLTRDGSRLVTAGTGGHVDYYDLAHNETPLLSFNAYECCKWTKSVNAVALDHDARLLATGEGLQIGQNDAVSPGPSRNAVKVWDLKTGLLKASYAGSEAPIRGLAFTREGDLAVLDTTRNIRVYGRDGVVIRTIKAGFAMAMSEDGCSLAYDSGVDLLLTGVCKRKEHY